MAETIDLGIDLGTTNSAVAVFQDGKAEVLKGYATGEILPSCVWFDGDTTHVGEIARNALMRPTDSINAFEGFKRFLGRAHSWRVESLGRHLTPEELSAAILRELSGWVSSWTGESPTEAVITIPAAFGEIEKRAVTAAAELAGFQRAILIQEPVAAGLAYGWARTDTSKPFLVYDFGGGTFDASVLRTASGQLVILGNHGNHTEGGRDMDDAILEKLVAPMLSKRLADDPLNLKRAKFVCEEAKKRLSSPGLESIKVNLGLAGTLFADGSPVTEQIQLFRSDLDELVRPQVQRTVDVVRRLLEDLKLRDVDLGAVILVGGPTKMPLVRRMLQDAFKSEVYSRIDPMTVVAQGAALFAASIPKLSRRASSGGSAFALRLEFDPVANTSSVPVGITGASGPLPDGSMIRVRRQDELWDSGLVRTVGGNIVLVVNLAEGQSSSFQIEFFDGQGTLAATEPAQFEIRRGIAAAAPPLSRAIGVGVVEIEATSGEEKFIVDIVAKRGQPTPLTARRHYTILKSISPGSREEVLRVGFFEGPATTVAEVSPDRCRLIGEVPLLGTDFDRPVPSGSDVEVTLRIDSSRQATARIYFPSIQKTFEGNLISFAQRSLPASEDLQGRLNAVIGRMESLEAAGVAISDLADRASEAGTAIDSAATGNEDALARAEARLEELELSADEIEADEAPRLALGELEGALAFAEGLLEFGEERHSRQMETLRNEAARARSREDAQSARAIVDRARRLGWEIYWLQPGTWVRAFQDIADSKNFTDGSRAEQLMSRGRQALEAGDIELLKRAVVDLMELIPREARDGRWSTYSGIARKA